VAAGIELICPDAFFDLEVITRNAAINACDAKCEVAASIELVCPDALFDPDVITCKAAVSACEK